MSAFETISLDQLARVAGGADATARQGDHIPQPVKDGVRIAATGTDIYRGQEPARNVVDRAMDGYNKGYNLPASNQAERLYHAAGGAVIDTFNLGW